MFLALIIVHVLVSILLVLIVLVQTGRGAELGAAFGGMGQATYGRTQGNFLTRVTTVLAVIFMSTSLSLAFISSEQPTRSILSEQAPAPAAPAQETQQPPPEPEEQPAAEAETRPPEQPLEQTKAPPRSETGTQGNR